MQGRKGLARAFFAKAWEDLRARGPWAALHKAWLLP